MNRFKHVLILAGVTLMIQAAMAMPALSADSKKSAKTAANTTSSTEDTAKTIATVNGAVITQSDMDRGMESITQRRASMGTPMDEAQLKTVQQDVLKNLINRELLNQESKKQKITVSDDQINDRLSKIKQRFKGDADFNAMLSKMKMTEPQIKTQLREDMAIQKLVDSQVVDKIVIPDQDVQAYYDAHPEAFKHPEQIKASHILVTVDPKADAAKKDEAHKKIESIQDKLKNGGDFAALAKEYSDCPSKEKGGDLGYFSKGQMVKPFEDAALALKPGETSGIVETQFGYHLIRLADVKPEGVTPFADVKEQVVQYLKQEKVKANLDSYIADLEKTAKIEKFLAH